MTPTGHASAASLIFKPASRGAFGRIKHDSSATSKTSGIIPSQALHTMHPGSIQTFVTRNAEAGAPSFFVPLFSLENCSVNSGLVAIFKTLFVLESEGDIKLFAGMTNN